MAKRSMLARETKRAQLVAKYAAKREALKTIVSSINASEGEIWQASLQLQKLPRDASPSRIQRRCRVTGGINGMNQKYRR